jgi:hypothetical protein
MKKLYVFFGVILIIVILLSVFFVRRDNFITTTSTKSPSKSYTLSNKSCEYLSFAQNIQLSNTPTNIDITYDFTPSYDFHTKIGSNRFISVNNNLLQVSNNPDYSWNVKQFELAPTQYQNYLDGGVTPLMIDSNNRINFGMEDIGAQIWVYLYLTPSLNFSPNSSLAATWIIK